MFSLFLATVVAAPLPQTIMPQAILPARPRTTGACELAGCPCGCREGKYCACTLTRAIREVRAKAQRERDAGVCPPAAVYRPLMQMLAPPPAMMSGFRTGGGGGRRGGGC